MDFLLELILLGALVIGFGVMVGRLVDRKLDKLEEETKFDPAQKPKRARNSKGHFIADDPSTPKVNEAWVDGKAPKTKPKKKKTTKKKAVKKGKSVADELK